MVIRTLLLALTCSAFLCVGCDDSPKPPADIGVTETPEVESSPIVLSSESPRKEAVRPIRYPSHGEEKELGMAKFGGAMVNVTQYGRILEGGEGHFLIDTGRTEVDGVYVWIGLEEDGKKRRWPATPEPEGFHVHCSVPRPLNDDHALWVEIKLPSGERYHGDYYIGER